MEYRRVPFQFTATDPLKRQQELEKRFGIPSKDKMYVDFANPCGKVKATSVGESNSASGSPRLQHRVPIFVEGSSQPVMPPVDLQNKMANSGRKPCARIIPIEVEGAGQPSTMRSRTFSGPSGFTNQSLPQNNILQHQEPASPTKRSMQDLSSPYKSKSSIESRVCNIPIQIESRDNKKVKRPVTMEGKDVSLRISNGCNVSKSSVSTEKQKNEPDIINVCLKKVEGILEELKFYEKGLEKFVGTVRDKKYRYLDEMLTRCMLNLDNIDTMGNETVRSSRKAAIRKVQACIDLLDSKINTPISGETDESMLPETQEDEQTVEITNQHLNKQTVTATNDSSRIKSVNDAEMKDIHSDLNVQKVPEVEMNDLENIEAEPIFDMTSKSNKTDSGENSLDTEATETPNQNLKITIVTELCSDKLEVVEMRNCDVHLNENYKESCDQMFEDSLNPKKYEQNTIPNKEPVDVEMNDELSDCVKDDVFETVHVSTDNSKSHQTNDIAAKMCESGASCLLPVLEQNIVNFRDHERCNELSSENCTVKADPTVERGDICVIGTGDSIPNSKINNQNNSEM